MVSGMSARDRSTAIAGLISAAAHHVLESQGPTRQYKTMQRRQPPPLDDMDDYGPDDYGAGPDPGMGGPPGMGPPGGRLLVQLERQ